MFESSFCSDAITMRYNSVYPEYQYIQCNFSVVCLNVGKSNEKMLIYPDYQYIQYNITVFCNTWGKYCYVQTINISSLI